MYVYIYIYICRCVSDISDIPSGPTFEKYQSRAALQDIFACALCVEDLVGFLGSKNLNLN